MVAWRSGRRGGGRRVSREGGEGGGEGGREGGRVSPTNVIFPFSGQEVDRFLN